MTRLWGVRHLRYAWHATRGRHQARFWARLGLGGGRPGAHDVRVLQAIWEGKA